MGIYVIKSIACLLVLLGFYKLALAQIKIPHINRCYLMGSIVFSIIIPLVTFSGATQPSQSILLDNHIPHIFKELPTQIKTSSPVFGGYWLTSVYLLGIIIFGVRFIIGLINLKKSISYHEKKQARNHTKVLISTQTAPYSFLQYIFLSKHDFEQGHIAKEVLLHEQAHIDQKHSLDILFVELLQIFFWWNPMIYWIKGAIKLNHEFLADQQAIKQVAHLTDYQEVLLYYSGSKLPHRLTSNISYSLTKKRILMISEKTSKKRIIVRLLGLVVILFVCLYSFNKKTWNQSKITASIITSQTLNIEVSQQQILVNKIATTPKEFTQTLNLILADWSKKQIGLRRLNIQLKEDISQALIQQLNKAARKTPLAHSNANYVLIPPKPSIAFRKPKNSAPIIKTNFK
ncbi:MAG TPA: hypothetical protein DCS93_29810 [Microscillaceae bacterium]|nr:hypothetical protein [Microscillaceae bacterium]